MITCNRGRQCRVSRIHVESVTETKFSDSKGSVRTCSRGDAETRINSSMLTVTVCLIMVLLARDAHHGKMYQSNTRASDYSTLQIIGLMSATIFTLYVYIRWRSTMFNVRGTSNVSFSIEI